MIEYFKGPVTVAIDSNHWSFAHYKGGIYRPKTCSKVHLDHAVLAVGYGVDEDTGEEYHILKNSWGKDWGEAGYMRMAKTATCAGSRPRPPSLYSLTRSLFHMFHNTIHPMPG